MKLLITGGCGFLGSNLACEALRRGLDLIIFDNLSRFGSEANLKWLESLGAVRYLHGDVRNYNDVARIIKDEMPSHVFHLAGQVAMTTSIADPRKDFEINVAGSFNLLEAVREFSPDTAILYSSTNKVYGDLEGYTYTETDTRYICNECPDGFREDITLNFQSPYGCSKGAADQYMLDYARIYGLKTAVFRHSSMYGGRQFSTYDQGWVGWFCQKAVEARSGSESIFTISGNGKQVRDVLHADDMIELYFTAMHEIDIIKGNAFNIGGGCDNSLSLLELLDMLEVLVNHKLNYRKISSRVSDQRIFIANLDKVSGMLGWKPRIGKHEGISRMVEWVSSIRET